MKPFSLFISDLHLDESRPEVTQAFIVFLRDVAVHAERLFILGDLFEYWAGDDDIDNIAYQPIIQAMASLHEHGCQLYVMHGNRDFLMGQRLMQRCQAQLLDDPTVMELYGQAVLLTHGDAMCTDDVSYQQFRQQVRQAEWQTAFLAQPLLKRKQQIDALRKKSEQAKQDKTSMMMDVNPQALQALFQAHAIPPLLIHGHTHRPHVHTHEVEGKRCTRVVLGDWYEQGSYLRLDADGYQAIGLTW